MDSIIIEKCGKYIEKCGKYDDDFETLRWVCQAVSGDETREAITHLKVEENGFIVATDGARLHCAMIERAIEPGCYEVRRTKKMIALTMAANQDYPDYMRVFPKNTHNGIPSLITGTASGHGYDHMSDVLNHVLHHTESYFNVNYLIDACPPDETLHFEQALFHGVGDILIIRNDDYTKAALVMPLRR